MALFEVNIQRVDELAEDFELLVFLDFRLDARPIHDGGRGEDAHARPDRQRQGIRRSSVDLEGSATKF
jgi:hypothetical protein